MTTSSSIAISARGRQRRSLLWSVQVLLAAFFLFASVPNLAGSHSEIHMFVQIGTGQWLRYFVGAAELAGAVGLLVPRLAAPAAAGLALDMVGASIVNVVVLHSAAVAMPLPLCVAFALIARRRWQPPTLSKS